MDRLDGEGVGREGLAGDGGGRRRPGFVTLRSIVIGCLMAVVIGLTESYLTIYLSSSYLFTDYHSGGASFLIAVVFLLLNALPMAVAWVLWRLTQVDVRATVRRLTLSTQELLFVTALMITAGSVVTSGAVVHMVPMMSSAYYFGTPSNRYAVDLVPHLKSWLAPLDPTGDTFAIEKFWNGVPSGEPIPWGPWVAPVLLWGLYLMAVFACLGAIMVLMRKQWMEHEHLSYPIAQIPAELCSGLGDPRGEGSIFRSKAFWVGLGTTLFLYSCVGLRFYLFGTSGRLRIDERVLLAEGYELRFWVEIAVVGLVFMIPNRIAFSVWFLTLTSWLLRRTVEARGWGMQTDMRYGGTPEFQHMVLGAMVVFVVASLWYARGHLKEATRSALGLGEPGYDRNEPVSYRAAFLTILVSALIMVVWLWKSGLSVPIALLFLVLFVAQYYTVARIIAQVGLPSLSTIVSIGPYINSIVGTANLGRGQAAALGHQFWNADLRQTPAVGMSEGMYLPRRRRGLFVAMMLVLLVTYVTACYCIIRTGYRQGASSLNMWFVVNSSQVPWWWYSNVTAQMQGASTVGLAWTGVGAVIMALLTLAQRSFFWWPIHPVGFLVCNTHMVYNFWFSVFLAWLIKGFVVKFGGYRGYRITRRLFIGLVLGAFMAGGLWAAVDLIAKTQGNTVFSI